MMIDKVLEGVSIASWIMQTDQISCPATYLLGGLVQSQNVSRGLFIPLPDGV